jgi:hypothetical protein
MMMKIKLLTFFVCGGLILLFLLNFFSLSAQVNTNRTIDAGKVNASEKKDGPTVSLFYKDTLSFPSFAEFDLQVKMKTGYEISAISLGLYYPQEYLEITGVVLADSVQGFYSSDTNGLIIVAWSDINPINIMNEGTILTLRMNALDLSGLTGTIKLGIYESSEFADKSANIIEGVELEIPEIQYLIPDPIDSIMGNYVKVYPNPFDDFAAINFYLKADSKVRISLSDLYGNEIYPAKETDYPKGDHQVKLHGLDLSKGVYLLKFEIINEGKTGSKLIKIISIR